MEGEVTDDYGYLTPDESNAVYSEPFIETNIPDQVHAEPPYIIRINTSSSDPDSFATETCVPLSSASIVINGPISFSLPENVSPSTVFISPYGDNTIVYIPLSPTEYARQNSS